MGSPSPSAEQAIEQLYEVEPRDFVRTRDELVRELRNANDEEGAKLLRGRRKPTLIAWVLNRLARQAPDAVAELVDVGRELARAQRRALRGEDPGGLRESIGRQRSAIRSLTARTTKLMEELGVDPSGHLDEVTSALQAAVVDPSAGAALEAGRLDRAPKAISGFVAAGDAGAAVEQREVRPKPASGGRRGAGRARSRGAEREETRRAKLREAEQRAARRERQRALEKSVVEARAAVRTAESAVLKAKRAADNSAEQAERATKRAAVLAEAAAKTERDAEKARDNLARMSALAAG